MPDASPHPALRATFPLRGEVRNQDRMAEPVGS